MLWEDESVIYQVSVEQQSSVVVQTNRRNNNIRHSLDKSKLQAKQAPCQVNGNKLS